MMNRKSSYPLIMGILNFTPDSFFDGGRYYDVSRAVDRAYQMVEEGADIIDIGGESTRPGSIVISQNEELKRVLPIVEKLTNSGFVVSVDTSSPIVMKAVLSLGVHFINDIRSFSSDAAIESIINSDCGLCIMHMQGQPSNMQDNPKYIDVLKEVYDALSGHIKRLLDVGVSRDRLIVDPGFGFGKKIEHNFQILARLNEAVPDGFPILVGLSRKSMLCDLAIDQMLNDCCASMKQDSVGLISCPESRLSASIAAALIACQNGANIVRVHDVKETKTVLKVLEAVKMFKMR